MTVLVLIEPCTKVLPHSPHPIMVMSPYSPTMISTLSCPGWTFQVAPSTSANPEAATQ